MTTKTLALAATTLMLTATIANAQQRGGRVSFDALDSNDDGKVTLAEFKENFAPPAQGGRTPNPDRVFGRWDADGNGELTEKEFNERPRRGQQNGQASGN